MAKQEQARSSRRGKPQEEVEAQNFSETPTDQVTTDILDEIDEVLEENAQEFVENYKQRGGQ